MGLQRHLVRAAVVETLESRQLLAGDGMGLLTVEPATVLQQTAIYRGAGPAKPAAVPAATRAALAAADTRTVIRWQRVANSPEPLAESNGVVVGGKLYVLGGYNNTKPRWTATNKLRVYNPATNTWADKAPLPRRYTHIGAAADSRYIYIAGGYYTNQSDYQIFATREVYRYDTQRNVYNRLPDLPTARGAGALTLNGRTLHYMAGVNANRVDQRHHWALNLDNVAAGWVTKAYLPVARNHTAAVAYNGSIYLLGGQFGIADAPNNKADCYRWDPNAGQGRWTRVADMPRNRSHHYASTFVLNGRIITIGGINTPGRDMADVTAYNPATNRWTALTPLPQARMSSVAAALPDGRIIVTGGIRWSLIKAETWIGRFV